VRLVLPAGERIGVGPVAAAMDGRTRMVSASSVSFVPGMRSDLEGIGVACREADALFLVDAAQSAGVLALDLAQLPVDAMACLAQKGLMGLYGLGLLYVAPCWAERLVPAYMARFGVDLGDAHEADIGSRDYRLMPGARHFDLGNYNFNAAAGLDIVLEMMARITPQAIEAQATGLAR
jgi:cysteine desulfurase / selenocysteine lyase